MNIPKHRVRKSGQPFQDVGGCNAVTITGRSSSGARTQIKLSSGQILNLRRFFPAGKDDLISESGDSIKVFARNDAAWIEIGLPWQSSQIIKIGEDHVPVVFKEIETEQELALFEDLRKFHYRGGGGAGRTVPIIATSKVWDLPTVLGFIEISSSMIANTARKRFFDYPFYDDTGPRWNTWDRNAAKSFSNIICRISRFVIHPEIRGIGIAKHFSRAACDYASERWHYGGFRPRFLEITADMLRYYPFIDKSFAFMGETEGNEHRVAKDMNYLVKKALSESGPKAMPQGGGGIMTLQRGYALQLVRFLKRHGRTLPEVVDSLRYDPSNLDQETWEALHKLNRRPKPCYVAGLSAKARTYVESRRRTLREPPPKPSPKTTPRAWALDSIQITVQSTMTQTAEGRLLQDAFGFVGADISAEIVKSLSLSLTAGDVTLISGASGSGKTLLLEALSELLTGVVATPSPDAAIRVGGKAEGRARVAILEALNEDSTPLDAKARTSLPLFLEVAAKCGLAEPQLFVRPVRTLSSGQKYRLQIALAFLRKPDVLIIDNFCEPLDRYTSIAVARGIAALSAEFNVAVVVATAAYERLKGIFTPSQTVLLRRGNSPVLLNSEGATIGIQEGLHGESLSDQKSQRAVD
jgi:energy-coupling factor transporter ATP-binding protein EcfA2/GNAT superfamily N-acetyltransferase